MLKELCHLTSLDLSSSNLLSIPETLGKLRLLKELNLQNNNIKCLPRSSENLYSLTKLDISKNQMATLPQDVSKWRRLAVLSASHNRLVLYCTLIKIKLYLRLRFLKIKFELVFSVAKVAYVNLNHLKIIFLVYK